MEPEVDTCSLKSWLRLLSICHIVDMKSSLEASNLQVLNGHLQGKVIISFISLSLEEKACLPFFWVLLSVNGARRLLSVLLVFEKNASQIDSSGSEVAWCCANNFLRLLLLQPFEDGAPAFLSLYSPSGQHST